VHREFAKSRRKFLARSLGGAPAAAVPSQSPLDCPPGSERGKGIVGIGQTVEAALRAFDAQYLAGLRPPAHGLRRGLYNSRLNAA